MLQSGILWKRGEKRWVFFLCLLPLLLRLKPSQKRESQPLFTLQITATTGEPRSFATSLVYSPDGRTLACAFAIERGEKMVAGEIHYWTPAKIQFYDSQSGELRQSVSLSSGSVNNLIFSPDGRLIRGDGEDGFTRWWEVASGRVVRKVWQGKLWLLASSSDGHLQLAELSPRPKSPPYNYFILLRDINTGKTVQKINVGKRPVSAAASSTNGQQLVLVGDTAPKYEYVAKWYRTSDFKLLRSENWGSSDVFWIGSGANAQIAGVGAVPFVWRNKTKIKTLEPIGDDYRCGALSMNGEWLAAGGYWLNPPWQSRFEIDYQVETDSSAQFGQAGVWELKSGRCLWKIKTGTGIVTAVALAPDKSCLAIIVSASLFDNRHSHVEVWPRPKTSL